MTTKQTEPKTLEELAAESRKQPEREYTCSNCGCVDIRRGRCRHCNKLMGWGKRK